MEYLYENKPQVIELLPEKIENQELKIPKFCRLKSA